MALGWTTGVLAQQPVRWAIQCLHRVSVHGHPGALVVTCSCPASAVNLFPACVLLRECLTVQVSVVDLSLPEATVASRVRDACLSSGFFYCAPPWCVVWLCLQVVPGLLASPSVPMTPTARLSCSLYATATH